jgi:hypothetical protein
LGVPVLETGAVAVCSSRFATTREDLLVAAGPSVGPGRWLGVLDEPHPGAVLVIDETGDK